MTKVIPILPCVNIDQQCEFYEAIGFKVLAKYRNPNSYAVVSYEDITLHFWGSKQNVPEQNASMVYLEVSDVDLLNEIFTGNIKKATNKVPRSAFPRISKVRNLKEDRRFTLCDPSGNTFYIGTPNDGKVVSERTLENPFYAKGFAMIYDLLHSHENPKKAKMALDKFELKEGPLSAADQKKLVQLTFEINEALKQE